jgi:integrase
MRSLIHEYASARQNHIREATLQEYLRLLRPFNNLQASTITRRQVAGLVEPLSRGVGRHTLTALSIIFKWAVSTGRMEHDPTWGLKKPPARTRDRVLDFDEMSAVWSATADGSHFSRIVRLLMLTGCRRDEIADLQWGEVKADRLDIPGDRIKNHRRHLVPLTPLAITQLPKRRSGWPYLFGRRRSTGFSGWTKAKSELDQRCGVTDWVLHDLRRSFVTHSAEMRLAPVDVIEAFVNHVSGVRGGVAGVYNRSQLWPERVALATAWSKSFDPPVAALPVPSAHPGR